MTAAAERQEMTDWASVLDAAQLRSRRTRFLLLVADPDLEVSQQLAAELAGHQMDVVVCSDGVDAVLQAGMLMPDAVVTAARIAPLTGSAIARAMRSRTRVPTLVGVGDDDGDEAIASLSAGAAACIRRPYRLSEMLPLLRSVRPVTRAEFGAPIDVGALRLDPSTMQVFLHGIPLHLPLREFQLLQLLMSHAGRVVTRQQIIRLIWNGEESSNTINVHIRRIRVNLGDDPHDPHIVTTVRGIGYRLDPPARRP